MKDIVEIHEFFVQGSNTQQSHVLLHISEPSFDEEDKGYFFALCEIIDGTESVISQVQKMIDDVEASYYESELTEKMNPFESSIEHINRRSHHLLENNNATLNLLFGVVENNKIYFASRGPVNAHLIYHRAGELHHVNVNEEKKVPEDQIFSSLVEGEIRINDFFVITTEPVEQYFSIDRIEKILGQKDTKASALHIQKTLEQVKSENTLSGIIIHRPTEENMPKLGKLPRIARPIQSSLPTAKSLLSSTLSNISKKLNPTTVENGIFNPQPKPLLETENPRRKTPKNIPRSVVFLANGLGTIAVAFMQLFRAIFIGLAKSFEFLFILATNRRGERKKSLRNLEIGIREKAYKVKRLPLISKILLIASIVAVLIFTGSTIFIKHQEKLAAEKQDYENKIALIRTEKDTADRSLLYGDMSTALEALKKAQEIVSSLSTHPNKNDEQLSQISTLLENDFKQIRKQTDVGVTLKADIGTQIQNAQTEKIVRIDNTIIAFSSSDQSYYFVNIDTGAVTAKVHDTLPNLLNASVPKENDKAVFITGPASIAQYNKTTDSLFAQEIAFPSGGVNMTNLLVYNRKLYTLDTKGNQIYRHSETQTGYDKGSAWISDTGIDLSNAVSFAIDGEVYILKSNGEILKLAAGKLQLFSVSGVEPTLKNPTQIWTYNDLKNIYVLEPSSKRVVVLDKNGVLVKQYTSSEWKNPTSMVVDEPSKKVYILDSNKIYSFPL